MVSSNAAHCVAVSLLMGFLYGYSTAIIGGIAPAIVQFFNHTSVEEFAGGEWKCTPAAKNPGNLTVDEHVFLTASSAKVMEGAYDILV